jgi:hypothetical protein
MNNAPHCVINGRVFLSSSAARYLHLKSPTLASGKFTGPTKDRIGNVDAYSIKAFPASLARTMKAKDVTGMAGSLTGTAKYLVDTNAANGIPQQRHWCR